MTNVCASRASTIVAKTRETALQISITSYSTWSPSLLYQYWDDFMHWNRMLEHLAIILTQHWISGEGRILFVISYLKTSGTYANISSQCQGVLATIVVSKCKMTCLKFVRLKLTLTIDASSALHRTSFQRSLLLIHSRSALASSSIWHPISLVS